MSQKILPFPCGWPNNSIFWRKKYYGWTFFILSPFLLFIYAQILYFWTIYLPFCVCAVLIVKDLKTIKDLFFFFFALLLLLFHRSMRYFLLYDFMFHLLLLCMEFFCIGEKVIFCLLLSSADYYCCICRCCCQYYICYIAKLKSWNIFIDEIITFIIDLSIGRILQLARKRLQEFIVD